MSATDLARSTLRALLDAGVREFVLSPGSRNTPLSLELAAADRAGVLRLHVRIDERSAAFLALGLAKGSARPAAVITTSGTAVANLHPAVIEASTSHTPLVVLSANRPLDQLGTGANQTIDQVGIFGSAARATVHLDDQRPGQWTAQLVDAVAALTGSADGPGPVQIDLGFTPPLVASGESALAPAIGQPPDVKHSADSASTFLVSTDIDASPRTLVVVAECGEQLAASAVTSATDAGFPVHVEASSALVAANESCLRSGSFLMSSALMQAHPPQQLIIIGRPTLGRAVPALASSGAVPVTIVHDQPGLVNALGTRRPACRADTVRISGTVDPEFATAWRAADAAAAVVLDAQQDHFDSGAAARIVTESAADLLVVASSNPIRDIDQRADRRPRRVLVNRGAAGIDGLVSTAIGAALADQSEDGADGRGGEIDARGSEADEGATGQRKAIALLGDLAFLHDSNGLILGPAEPRPNLTIVVINNDGGAIFAVLEQGAAQYAEDYERVFGTPHGVDIEALCASSRTPYARCGDHESLRRELAKAIPGIRVIEVPVSREQERERRADLAQRVIAAADATLR